MVGTVNVRGVTAAINTLTAVKTGYGRKAAWIVGVGAEYGAYLELGTSRMQAYPFLFPAARHVVARDFIPIERRSRAHPEPTEYIVARLALNIEAQAKNNASADRSVERSPGTHPDHPRRPTGNLVGSIRAVPKDALSAYTRGGA